MTPATLDITAPAASTATLAATRPGCHGRADSSGGSGRRIGTKASSVSSATGPTPPISPARYSVLDANPSVTGPVVPGGSTQPCCHPLTVTGLSTEPSPVRAVHPGLTLSGTTSTRDA